ncbi:MAG: DUF3784 domain-containing protein [Streptococcaceae bacterium]|jgi:hypothetical protein|nr:DUF3784 domain-containing protein [Streptococcaceae bacterium]
MGLIITGFILVGLGFFLLITGRGGLWLIGGFSELHWAIKQKYDEKKFSRAAAWIPLSAGAFLFSMEIVNDKWLPILTMSFFIFNSAWWVFLRKAKRFKR